VPPQVPFVVTPSPAPSPSYGVPGGMSRRPSYGSPTVSGTYRAKPKPRHKKKRRPRTSEIVSIRTI
jgi:hypothetical protein